MIYKIPTRQPYRVTSDARQHIARPSTLCGIDFIDLIGKPDLLSMADGYVQYVYNNYNPQFAFGGGAGGWDTLGRFVVIKSTIKDIVVWLRYGHCERIDAQAGDTVSAGQCIGEYGNTGASRGAHVHLDAWVAWGDLDRARALGLIKQAGLRVVPPYPGLPISLHNVDPTEFFTSAGLDVVNTGGK